MFCEEKEAREVGGNNWELEERKICEKGQSEDEGINISTG